MTPDIDIRVQLERMEGTINLTNQKMDTVAANVSDLKREVSQHGDRIGKLEATGNIALGERRGIGLAAKIMYAAGGGGLIGAAVFVARAFGV